MIWALLALYLFGSSGTVEFTTAFEHAKPFIKTEIKDKARQAELTAIVEQAAQETKHQAKAGEKIVQKLLDISERHDAKTADFLPGIEKLRADSEAYQDRMIRHRFELKAKMSREEWSMAFPEKQSSTEPAAVQTDK